MSKCYKYIIINGANGNHSHTHLVELVVSDNEKHYIEEEDKGFIIDNNGKSYLAHNIDELLKKLVKYNAAGPFLINLIRNNKKALSPTKLEFKSIYIKKDIANYTSIVDNLLKYAEYSKDFNNFIKDNLDSITTIPAQYILHWPKKEDIQSLFREKKILINPDPVEFKIEDSDHNQYLSKLMDAYGIVSYPTPSSIIKLKDDLPAILQKTNQVNHLFSQVINAFAMHPKLVDKWFNTKFELQPNLNKIRFSLLMLNDEYLPTIFQYSSKMRDQIIFYFLHNDTGYSTFYDYFVTAKKLISARKLTINDYYEGVKNFRKFATEALSEFTDDITTDYLIDVLEFLDNEYSKRK